MEGRSHPRRPVWQMGKLSRRVTFRDVLKQVTFRRTLLAAFVLPVLFYIYREVTRDALIIDPFTVPKRFEEAGFTSEVVANRIGDELRQLETTPIRMKKDNLSLLRDAGAVPDVEIPGTKIGLKTIVEVTRTVFGIYPKHVSGDIVVHATTLTKTESQATVTFYITQGRNRSRAISHVVTAGDDGLLAQHTVGLLAQRTAEMVLEEVNPYVLAVYRVGRHELDEAVGILRRIIRNPSEDRIHVSAAYSLWGVVLSDQRECDQAIAKYRKAIEINPKYALAVNNWGAVFDYQRNYDEAVAKYRKAIGLDPKYPDAYDNWGKVLYSQRKYDEAVAKYRQAIDLDPKHPLAYNLWANVLFDQRKYDDAVAKCRKAIDVDPKNADAYNNWGNVLSARKKYDEATASYRKAIDLDPKYPLAYDNWGYMLYEQKGYEEAVAKFQKAIDVDPKYALAYDHWGLVLS